MKLHALLLAVTLFNATLAKAYDTDDYGFPRQHSSAASDAVAG